MIGRTIADRYEIIEPIGAGGMGAVYLARQVAMDRNVAVKVLHQQFLRDESSRKAQRATWKNCTNVPLLYCRRLVPK